jgi:hypothetical protein
VGEVGIIQGHKVSRHSGVVLLIEYLFWDEYVKEGV